MQLKIFQIDAFAHEIFSGNPAAVVPLKEWLPVEVMQNIAMENNLSETAFFIKEQDRFHIRWFTPSTEVNLCGHATLASAHVIFNYLGYKENEIIFNSRSGILKVKMEGEFIILNFPVSGLKQTDLPENVEQGLGIRPIMCLKGREDLLFLFNNEEEIKSINPDFRVLKTFDMRGIIVTSASEKFDFVSRFFAPKEGIDEDPVTGSAHTVLIPFWSARLQKKELTARQISSRGGILKCWNMGERVEIGGKCITYLSGTIYLK
ncbi:MAG: PhzF family phenazine biosynthesis protein [Prolixibacteraceae bacterium]|nr:PhzF family phenazine biosynthesis protein [Prolixibacteraceae bacterium]